MHAKRILPLLLTFGLTAIVGCPNIDVTVTPPTTKGPKAPSKKGTPSPEPTPSATPSAAPSASATPAAAGSPTPTPGIPASQAEIDAATVFPFTTAGTRWTYTLAIKAGSMAIPGTLVIEAQTVTADGAGVRSTFTVDMSKTPLGANKGPTTVDKVQQIKKGSGTNPYAQIIASLFEGETKPGATPPPAPSAPVSTKEDVKIGDKTYQTVRQKFTNNFSGTDVEFNLFMTAAEGMVKELVKSKKLPPALLPPQAAMLASLGLDMTLTLDKKEQGVPSTPLPSGSPSDLPSAVPTGSTAPSATPTSSATPTTAPTASPTVAPTATP